MQASIEMRLCCHEFSHLHNQTFRRLEGWSWVGAFFFIPSFVLTCILNLFFNKLSVIFSWDCQRAEDDPDWSLPQQSSMSLLLPCNLPTSFRPSPPRIRLFFTIRLFSLSFFPSNSSIFLSPYFLQFSTRLLCNQGELPLHLFSHLQLTYNALLNWSFLD